jgi:hypothetical protein
MSAEGKLKKRIAELEAKLKKKVYLKVSKKGGVSLYGLRRFPITLYADEWETVLDMDEEIREFLKKNKSKMNVKGDTKDEEDEEEE